MAPSKFDSLDVLLILCLEPSFMCLTEDAGGQKGAFEAVLVSDRFSGLPPAKRACLVFQLLGSPFTKRLKRLHMHCYTPNEWEASGRPGEAQARQRGLREGAEQEDSMACMQEE
ncbi:hypothetical protein Efla_003279 [Eimeria flavescens]